MFKRNITKIIVLVLSLLAVTSVSVFATTYNFYFKPPFIGSIRHSSPATANGAFTPYVQPSGTTNATTYVLTMPEPDSIVTVSNARTNVTSGIAHFTYNSGYGGAGQRYKLTGYPSNMNFLEYRAAGNWKP